MSRTRRGSGERGAAMVEFSIMAGFLILIVFGILEFGHAWSERLKVETAARAGARVGSNLTNDRLADWGLLQGSKSVLNEIGLSNVEYLVVFKASSATGTPPTGCGGATPTSQNNQCNVYTGAQLTSLTQSSFTGTSSCTGSSPDRFWCPTTRLAVQHLNPDYLGIYIKARSQTLTSLFGPPLGLRSTAVMRLEPKG